MNEWPKSIHFNIIIMKITTLFLLFIFFFIYIFWYFLAVTQTLEYYLNGLKLLLKR